jgi:hypothetical protein
LVSRVVWSQTAILSAKPVSRNAGKTTIGLWITDVSTEFQHSAIQTRIVQHFGRFFHQINMPQPIGRKDSIQTVILTSWRLDSVLYEAAQNFEVFSNIQKGNKKIKYILRLMFFSRPIQWYHSNAEPIWPDITFNLADFLSSYC